MSVAGSAASGAPGAPTISETAQFGQNAQTQAQSSTTKYVWEMPITDARAGTDFPLVKTPFDPYDDIANIKAQYANGVAAGTNWTIPFEQADAAWLQRKRNAEEKASFDSWIMQRFNTTNPTENMMLQSIAPDLYRRREQIIDQQQDLVSRYAKLRLRGPKTIDDLKFEWLLETGRISLPKGPIWDPRRWRGAQFNYDPANPAASQAADEAANAARYQYGLFSPIKWLTWNQRGWQRNPANPADIRGTPGVPYDATAVGRTLPPAAMANAWGPYAPYPYVAAALPAGSVPGLNSAGAAANMAVTEATWAPTV